MVQEAYNMKRHELVPSMALNGDHALAIAVLQLEGFGWYLFANALGCHQQHCWDTALLLGTALVASTALYLRSHTGGQNAHAHQCLIFLQINSLHNVQVSHCLNITAPLLHDNWHSP